MLINFTPIAKLMKAARDVIATWERGDLAGSVRDLEAAVNECHGVIDLSESNPDIIEQARDMYANDELQIDDSPVLAPADDGTWVSAWVWVPKEDGQQAEAEDESVALTGLTLLAAIIEKIADIKTSNLIRTFAPAYYREQGESFEYIPLPDVPDLSLVVSTEALNTVLDAYMAEAKAQWPDEDKDISDILEFGRGAKFHNELYMGDRAESFLKHYLALVGEKDNGLFVDSYDLNCAVFYTDSLEEANEFAGLIAPATVFEIDSSTTPPAVVEMNSF